MTDAERAMWRLLKLCAPDARWRRQVPIRHFIVDFASHRAKLVVEVDGGQHSEEADADRTAIIEAEGYRVLRFWNNEFSEMPEGCVRISVRRARGALTPIQLRLGSKLPSLRILPPSRGKGELALTPFPLDGGRIAKLDREAN